VPGATVLGKGNNNWYSHDLDGKYLNQCSAGSRVLSLGSCTALRTQEVNIAIELTWIFSMSRYVRPLSEFVITSYGSIKEKVRVAISYS